MTALTLTQRNALEFNDFAAISAQFQHYPMLSLEQEQTLTQRVFHDKDRDAAQQLILSHMRYVIKVAKGYMNYGLPAKDLVQEGTIGLMKAVKNFDPSVGVRLVTYAGHWVKAEIQEYILKNWRLVKIATTKAQRKLFFNLRKLRSTIEHLSQTETQAIAQELDVSVADVSHMSMRMGAAEESFEPFLEDDDNLRGMLHSNRLSVPEADPALILANSELNNQYQEKLNKALTQLNERERTIINQRWFADKKVSLKILAEQFGVSLERVRQIEAEAIEKMRATVLS